MAVNADHRRKLAIDALLRTPTIESASRLSGISARTIRRYCSEPAFLDELQNTRRKLFDHALDVLLLHAEDMATAIHTIASNVAAPEAARVSAARSGLAMLKDVCLLESLEQRLLQLETKAEVRSDEVQGNPQSD